MSVNGKFTDITRKDLIDVADRFGILGAGAIIDEVEQVTVRFGEFADAAQLPKTAVEEITQGLTKLRR
jgi:hypothetical protein